MGKLSFGGVANTLLQWKLHRTRAAKRRSQSIAIDARHFALMGAIADKIKIQLPRSLVYSLKEEVHPILVETVQGYKREVGKKHRLTIQAQQRLEELTKELEKPH
ncbi:uncharacterized protein LOC116292726 [Actinia tenebrosa]|uniref:Uncharacterized protein LOC116292726 n=1 Tax=Actinia tenebrosa TaxID=6105 RepID=A0A6P8HJC4_ACTTE|nr:uncharacterized protein LOC116292726 [Actinia tenebrosa]